MNKVMNKQINENMNEDKKSWERSRWCWVVKVEVLDQIEMIGRISRFKVLDGIDKLEMLGRYSIKISILIESLEYIIVKPIKLIKWYTRYIYDEAIYY